MPSTRLFASVACRLRSSVTVNVTTYSPGSHHLSDTRYLRTTPYVQYAVRKTVPNFS